MSRSILLASFVEKKDLYDAIEHITKTLDIDGDQIFVFLNEETRNEYVLTYNLNSEYANIKFNTIWKNTISVHRKKQTNTIYSLNAMNEYIKSKCHGIVDKSYQVNWEQFENSLMIIKNGKLKVIPLRIVRINQ